GKHIGAKIVLVSRAVDADARPRPRALLPRERSLGQIRRLVLRWSGVLRQRHPGAKAPAAADLHDGALAAAGAAAGHFQVLCVKRRKMLVPTAHRFAAAATSRSAGPATGTSRLQI